MNSQAEPQSSHIMFFNPDDFPDTTLKAFTEFTQSFELRYNAKFPDPPTVSFEAALKRWKISNATNEVPDPTPTLNQYDEICEEWKSKDRVAKFLGMFSSSRFQANWRAAEPDETVRNRATWRSFVQTMENYYKPTDNPTLKNYHFRSLSQNHDETFPAFCNRVQNESKHCNFKCLHDDCTAAQTAVRDQIVIGTNSKEIREEALLRSWDLKTLRHEGMKLESALKGGAEITGEQINKVGRYSYSRLKDQRSNIQQSKTSPKQHTCFYCGNQFSGPIPLHREKCPAKDIKCHICNKQGHFAKVCKSKSFNDQRNVPTLDDTDKTGNSQTYNINLFHIRKSLPKPTLKSNLSNKQNFKVEVIVNNSLAKVIADTGATVSVCGTVQAKKWNLLDKLIPTHSKLKPYNSEPIAVYGIARCSVSFGNTSIPVEWHVISGSCEPILSGNNALQLGIIKFTATPKVFHPLCMIDQQATVNHKDSLQSLLAKYPENFNGLGKLKNHCVKLHTNPEIKPVAVPPRSVPYHLKERVDDAIDEMIRQDVIEEHPINQPAPWISCAVIAPKPDGAIRVTLDARNVNKAIQSTNSPIPRQEDIKSRLANATVFSKMDFKSAFWQLELHPDSRYLTVFHANDKLYRYKRLTMGLKPAQGELNSALQPLFAHIPLAHLIHDDLIIAATTPDEHDAALDQVMQAINAAGLTLNPQKCEFGQSEIKFWGMTITSEGVGPDPSKVDALDHLRPPTSKQDLNSFLCMMQSNSDFIPNFSKRSATLRELTKTGTKFTWESQHETCFRELIATFRKDIKLRYFDMNKPTFVIVDAHITGIGAILAQGDSIDSAKPVALASRTTSQAEKRYPQLDLEATAIDFGLRRFRNYLVGSPECINVITDHKPLCSVFNGNRSGSIRTERIKLRHQDIRYRVSFQPGHINQSDFMSRNATPLSNLPNEQQNEPDELNNLLYTLHTTPLTDHIGLASISAATTSDPILQRLKTLICKGQNWIPQSAPKELQRFGPIIPEITVTGNDILCKGDRLILPDSLQPLAIQLCHRGSHPGQSSMQRRLRSHFFFHDMNFKIEKFIHECKDCFHRQENKCTSTPTSST